MPRDETPGPQLLTAGKCHDHFKRTLAGSKWEVLRGLHTLRHSVASCLAAAGVDQRIIADFRGGVTCLFPTQFSTADEPVFPGFFGL
jgi:hypothetical protein